MGGALADRVRVLSRPKGHHVLQVGARNLGSLRRRARSEEQPVEPDPLPPDRHGPTRDIDRIDPCAGPKLDVGLLVEALVVDTDLRVGHPTQVLLGKLGPLVRRFSFLTEEDDAAIESGLPERGGRACTGKAGTDDHVGLTRHPWDSSCER